jgi:tetratricopeptide (TPR) repeat protein
MFGSWGQAGRRKKAAAQLEAKLRVGGDARTLLGAVSEPDRAEVVALAIASLLFDDARDRAAELARAALDLNVRDDDARRAIAAALHGVGEHRAAIAVCERALDDDPEDERWILQLTDLLIADGRAQEALELLDEAAIDTTAAGLCRAQALTALERPAEALELADRVCEAAVLRMKKSFDAGEWELAKAQYTHASELRASLQAELHGAETIALADARRGHLDGRSGVNYRLLAESLMTAERSAPAHCYLQTPDETRKRSELAPKEAVSLALRGSAELRLGKVDDARRSFEAACEADKRHFAGLRGLAAVRDFDEHALWSRAMDLPALELAPDAQRVIVDHAALTERELRVVAASVAPLSRLLPPLVAAGAVMRLLPIDVRTVDLPEWRTATGARFADDHRAMDTLGGVADSEAQLAAARIEELLDVVSEHGFTFAHELAHLVFFHVTGKLRDRVLALYERALAAPHVAGEYQLSNEHEFFAISYQDYVRMRYGMPAYRMPDDEGVLTDTFALFDSLSATRA